MNKEGKSAVKRKTGIQQSTTKTVQPPRLVTGTEIPNLLKKRPFKIRYY
jgi:hypothetical protein